MSRRTRLRAVFLVALATLFTARALGATWHYTVSFERAPDRRGRPRGPGTAHLWLPPASWQLRGLLVLGKILIEKEMALDPRVRAACAEGDVGIVYFEPHVAAVFTYWKDGSTDAERFLEALDDLAARAGRAEIGRVPWITAGHSTGGIYCRNVAYWKPERVASILHIKSGNFHQDGILPPGRSIAGVPLVAINGHFETFGPEGGIREEYGRETQWVFVRKDIQRFRAADPNHLMSLLVHPGADHFHGAPELYEYMALFIRKTGQYRLPRALPAGDGPVPCRPVALEDGWLTDPEIERPTRDAAPYKSYSGNRAEAFWHFDEETARAVNRFHERLTKHQALENPKCTWLDDGDGWTLRASAKHLDTMPATYGGSVGGAKAGRPAGPIEYRCKLDEPVVKTGADTFRLTRWTKKIHIAAFHPGDHTYRSTIRWSGVTVPKVKGASQSIDFPAVAGLGRTSRAVTLRATASSGLPVHYVVEYGPVAVDGSTLTVSDVPIGATFPMECKVTAYQVGRRAAPAIRPAKPVSRTFEVTR